MSLGVYVHIPFCASRCDFCAFYQEPPQRSRIQRFVQTLGEEWKRFSDVSPIDTLFFGGGTPSILTNQDFFDISRALDLKNQPLSEWSVEFSPATVTLDKLLMLKDLGVTRISLGLQSFSRKTLERLGRRDGPTKIYRALELLKQVDITLNLDLIFSAPGQTIEEWEQDLRQSLDFEPDSISTYCLTVEAETVLESRMQESQIVRAQRDEEFYSWTWQYLERAGYEQYEVSNFARPGKRCRHHMNVWQMGEWLGLGPSAASQYGQRRWTNVRDLSRWERGVYENNPQFDEEVFLDGMMMAEDVMIFGLRTVDGFDRGRIQRLIGVKKWGYYENFFRPLLEDKLLCLERVTGSDVYRPTMRGLLLADEIAANLLLVRDSFSEASGLAKEK